MDNKQKLFNSIPTHLRYAARKARFRGMISEIWHKRNHLTQENLFDFLKLMKEADKEFDELNDVVKIYD